MTGNILKLLARTIIGISSVLPISAPISASAQDGASCLAAISLDNDAQDQYHASTERYIAAVDNDQCTLQLMELHLQLQLMQKRLSYIGPTTAACINQTVIGGSSSDQLTKAVARLQRSIESERKDCDSGDPFDLPCSPISCEKLADQKSDSCKARCASTDLKCIFGCDISEIKQGEACDADARVCEAARLKPKPHLPGDDGTIGCFGICPPGQTCNASAHKCQ
jgi:hypothetical protein